VLDFDLLAWARDMVSMGRERKYKSRSEWELQLVAYVFATLLSLGG
jgi:hypothetical protein